MARIRSLKPEFWTDEKLAGVPREIRHTFIGVISSCADDAGRFKANPRLVKAAVYPLDDDISAVVIRTELETLGRLGVIQFYTVNGEHYGHVVNWAKHQKIDKATKSRLPDPPGFVPDIRGTIDEYSTNPPRTLATEAEAERSEEADLGSGERKRKGHSGNGGSDTGTLARWLAHFYGDKTPARREQIREQLSTLYRGHEVGFRKTTVRAHGIEHLERKAAEMLDVGFTIKDTDKAIVILLQKLQDPEKDARGLLPGEAAAEAAKAREQLEDLYETDRKKALAAWQNSHADENAAIEQDIRGAMMTPKTDIGYRAELTARVNARVAEAIQFPDFDSWQRQRKAS